MRSLLKVLEGTVARWMVTLHNANAPELRNFNIFMMALRQRFEDLLADCRGRNHIKIMQQGC